MAQSVITDLLAMKNSVSDDVKRSMMELGDVKARVGEGTARVGALTASIEGLNAQLTVGPGWTPAQKAKFANLQGTRTDLRAGLDVKRAAMATLRRDVDIAMNAVEQSQKANAEVRGEIDGVKDDTQASVAKAAKLTVAQGRQTAELKGAQAEVEVAHVEAEAREALVAQGDAALKRMEAALKARKAEVERVLQEYAALHAKTAATTAELDSQLATNETLSQDIQRIRAHIEEFRKEEHAFVTEVERCVALHGLAAKRLAETSQQLVEVSHGCYVTAPDEGCDFFCAGVPLCVEQVEEEASKLQEESAGYRKESDVISRSNEALQRSLQDLIKERDILRGSIEKMSDNTVAVETLMAAARSSQKMTESETLTLHKNVRDVREGIEDMHDQLAALEEKFLEANRRVIRTQEQVSCF
jgi:chromosome segregation ATPase